MASTYSTNLAIELIGTGDQAGAWGNTTNTNLGTLIEQAISGYVTQAVSTGTDTTITIPNGATGVARNMYIELTGTGGASTNLIVPANKKLYFIFNNTSSGQVTVKVSGQTGVSVPNKAKIILVSNGTDVVDATNYIGNISAASANITVLTSASATITNLIATSASITTLTNNPTFSGGTANGVLYLNGSKVATSGSALTFDGTNLTLGGVGSGSRLVVRGTGTTSATFSIEAATSGGATRFLVADDGLTRWYGTTNAETMRLDNAGNLGIGTTPAVYSGYNTLAQNATTGSTFEQRVGGTLTASLTTDSQVTLKSLTAIPLVFGVNNSEQMRLTSTGLGIGTSSPAVKLQVAGAIRSTSSITGPLTNLYTSATNPASTGASGNGLNFGYDSNAEVSWIQSNRNDITETRSLLLQPNGGLVGIGTSSPIIKVHVSATDATGVAGIRLQNTTATTGKTWQIASGNLGVLQLATIPGVADYLTMSDSGNLGLGVTPSAWVNATAAQVGFGAAISSRGAGSTASDMTHNAFWDGTNWKYVASSVGAARYQMTGANAGSTHAWFTSVGGTAGNAITFTQAMTLAATGNLLVGTTVDSNARLTVVGGGLPTNTGLHSIFNQGTSSGRLVTSQSDLSVTNNYLDTATLEISAGTTSTASSGIVIGAGSATVPNTIRFFTATSERARITSGGYSKFSNSGSYVGSAANYHEFNNDAGDWVTVARNFASSSAYGIYVLYSASAPNGTGNEFLYCADSGTARATIRSNGGLANYQTNDVNLSDERVKKDVNPLGSMWAKIKALEIVTFKYKDQTHDDDNIGLIAQQVEAVAPEFVDADGWGETPEDGVPLKSIYTADMYHGAIKALQEAMARIEQLEADVAAMKGAA